MIEINAAGHGHGRRGRGSSSPSLEEDIADAVGEHPQLEGKSTMFLTHVDTTDLSEVSFYTPFDTRSAFFEDLGLATPASVADGLDRPEQFSRHGQRRAGRRVRRRRHHRDLRRPGAGRRARTPTRCSRRSPPSRTARSSLLPDTPLGTAANPTPLAISWVLEDYVVHARRGS